MKQRRFIGYVSKSGAMGWENIKNFGEILFLGVSKKKKFWGKVPSVKVEIIVREKDKKFLDKRKRAVVK